MYQQDLLSFMSMIFPNLTDLADLTPIDLSQELLVINPIESILGKATNEDGFLPLMEISTPVALPNALSRVRTLWHKPPSSGAAPVIWRFNLPERVSGGIYRRPAQPTGFSR